MEKQSTHRPHHSSKRKSELTSSSAAVPTGEKHKHKSSHSHAHKRKKAELELQTASPPSSHHEEEEEEENLDDISGAQTMTEEIEEFEEVAVKTPKKPAVASSSSSSSETHPALSSDYTDEQQMVDAADAAEEEYRRRAEKFGAWHHVFSEENIKKISVIYVNAKVAAKAANAPVAASNETSTAAPAADEAPRVWLGWNLIPGSKYPKKVSGPTPLLSVYDIYTDGSGRTFLNESPVKGKQSMKMTASASVIEERVRKIYGLSEDMPLTPEAQTMIDDAVFEGKAFCERIHKIREHVANILFDMDYCTNAHAKTLVKSQINNARCDDDDLGVKKDRSEYEKVFGTPRERYIVNIHSPPKDPNNTNAFSYTDITEFRERLEGYCKQSIALKRTPWTSIYDEVKPNEREKMLNAAFERAKADIALCNKLGYPADRHQTALLQLSQRIGQKPMIYTPVTIVDSNENLIETPWDGTNLFTGDLCSTQISFKVTVNKGIVYFSIIFDKVVVYYRCVTPPPALLFQKSTGVAFIDHTPIKTSLADECVTASANPFIVREKKNTGDGE